MARKGKCIFCGNVGLLTHEHIWADWLKKYIPKNMPNHRAGRMIRGRQAKPIKVTARLVGGDLRSKRVRCVCASETYAPNSKHKGCNDGWMKDIQDQAKPIVVPLIDGQACSLNVRQQRILSAWIAMAVICSEYSHPDDVSIREKDRNILRTKHVPPANNWKIWVGRHQKDPSRRHWLHHTLKITKEVGQTSTAPPTPYNTQSTTYSVGELFIHAISSAYPKCVSEFHLTRSALPILFQIWPVRATPLRWPPRRPTSSLARSSTLLSVPRIADGLDFFLLLTPHLTVRNRRPVGR
jgi:hypothetical protein